MGDAHGDIEGRIILADSNPLIELANFSRKLNATGRTRYATEFSPSTSIFHTDRVQHEVKYLLFPSTDACSSISTVEPSLDLWLT